MKTFKVTKTESFDIGVDQVAKSMAKASTGDICAFIAYFFETLSEPKIDEIAKRLTASGFHRGSQQLELLYCAIKYQEQKTKGTFK